MADKQYLYVPISVKGLIVGADGNRANYFESFYDYTNLSKDVLGGSADREFVFKKNIETGIHIHWSLPDGLTRGKEKDIQGEKDIVFSDVPNRWLVSRIWTVGGECKLHIKNWIVESNALFKSENKLNKGSHTFPHFEKSDTPYRFLGLSYEFGNTDIGLKEIIANASYLKNLKAVEIRDSTYAAYYPASRNVFGLYDDMLDEKGNDLGEASVCYCVCGWYDSLSDDPLKGISNKSSCIQEFGWNPPDNASFKDINTLCHGTLSKIAWKGKNSKYQTSVPKNAPVFCVGNTTAEAVAADNGNSVDERVLTHLLSDSLRSTDCQDDIIKAENELHSARFSEIYSTFDYILKPKDTQPANNTNDSSQNEIKNKLLELNEVKNTIVATDRELKQKKQELYDTWINYMLLRRERETVAIRRKKIECRDRMSELEYEIKELNKTKISNTRIENDLASQLGDIKSNELSYVNEKRYSMPNNIVMLLKNVKRDYTHGFDGRFSNDNTLKTRIKAIEKIEIKHEGASKAVAIGKDLIKHGEYVKDKSLLARLIAIINEAALLNPDFAKLFASCVIKTDNGNAGKEDLAKTIMKLQTAINLAAYKKDFPPLMLANAIGADSDYPDLVAVEYFTQSWNPIYLVWECEYFPDLDLIDNPTEIVNWERGDTDYNLVGIHRISEKAFCTLRGRNLITPHAAKQMKTAMERLSGHSAGAEDMMVLSQELDEINQSLLKINTKTRYMPYDLSSGDSEEAQNVAEALGDFDFESYNPGLTFAPLRAGKLNFTKVWIVDSFGQVQEININKINIADNLRDEHIKNAILLPPRLMQPARLNLIWNLKNENPSAMICGFVLPNIMENSLHIYDENGVFIGSFQKSNDSKKTAKWICPGDTENTSGLIPKDINKDLYSYLAEIDKLTNKNNDIISYIVSHADASLSSINPKNASQLDPVNLLFGRPLALIKASVALESMDALVRQKRFGIDAKNENTDVDLSKVKFKVYIGQPNNHNDGVVGFFENGDYSTLHSSIDFETLYNKKQKKYQDNIYFSEKNYVELKINGSHADITLLADPIAEINIESLFLPMTTVRIEQQVVSRILDNLFHTVFVAPILTVPGNIKMPVPDIDGKVWSYLNFSGDVFLETEDISSPAESDSFEENRIIADEGWLKLKKQKNN